MKTLIISTLSLLLANQALAAGKIISVKNKHTVQRQLEIGALPSTIEARIIAGGSRFDNSSQDFGWVKVNSAKYGTEKFATKEEALAALSAQVEAALEGDIDGTLERAMTDECKDVNGRPNFNVHANKMTFVQDLMDMGYVQAREYRVSEYVGSDFTLKYAPSFTLVVPCNYSK